LAIEPPHMPAANKQTTDALRLRWWAFVMGLAGKLWG
jgi:hypothetical protein